MPPLNGDIYEPLQACPINKYNMPTIFDGTAAIRRRIEFNLQD